jgi:hypothetical protein
MSNRRSAQLGLLAASVTLAVSVGALLMQGSDNSDVPSPAQGAQVSNSGNSGAGSSLAVSVSMASAPHTGSLGQP